LLSADGADLRTSSCHFLWRANWRSSDRSLMATRDEHQNSKKSVLLVDAAATPVLYQQDTPALTPETILERSRQRCPPSRSPLLDTVRRAARASAGRLSASARGIHDRAIDLGSQLKAAVRPELRLPAAYRGFQAVLQRPRPRPGRLAAGVATLVLLMVLAITVTRAPEPRRTSLETQAAGSVGVPSLPTVAPESRLADRSVPLPSISTKVGTTGKRSAAASVGPLSGAVEGPVAATRWKAPSTDKSGSRRRAVSTGLVGTLLVNSEPSGAEVLINGIPHGRTPLRVSALPVGSRVIRLELPGYDRWSWAVNIAANKRTPLRVKLQPERRRRIPGS
jgi:PEGA domain-containing protein